MRSEFCPSIASLLRVLAVSGVVALAGCGSSPNPVTTTMTTTTSGSPASSVYVVQGTPFGTSAILQFAANSTGVATPTATLTAPVGVNLYTVSLDSGGQIYAAGTIGASATTSQVLVYAAGATGAATALRTITGGPSSFVDPMSMAIDTSGNLYVADGGSNPFGPAPSNLIAVFSPTASGTTTPVRLLQGNLTQISSVRQIAVDAAGNLYVANGDGELAGKILVFGPGATGNVAPVRIISTGSVNGTTGLAVDSAANVYAAAYVTGCPAVAIVEYAENASGNASPMKTICGDQTGLGIGGGLSVDAAGNIYTVASRATAGPGAPGPLTISKFGASASGNVAPVSAFTSTSWTAIGAPLISNQVAIK